MRKGLLLGLIFVASFYEGYSQYRGRFGAPGSGYRRERLRDLEPFTPALNVSVGYGFPNLDRYLLADFYDYYHGNATQTGPIIANIDYRFSRRMSIGVMINYGKVSQPYYNYYTGVQEFTGHLENMAILLNFTRYMGVGNIEPYTRTAIGFNTGQSTYVAMDGSKFADEEDGTSLAYQVGLGVQFKTGKHGAFFVEAGYGKYILAGGLTLRF